jgi:hypothetical protein
MMDGSSQLLDDLLFALERAVSVSLFFRIPH